MVGNAARIEDNLALMQKQQEERFYGKDVRIEYVEDKSLIALQGPKSAYILQKFLEANLSNLNFMQAKHTYCYDIDENVLVSRSGYTGEDGFEISLSNKNAVNFFDLLMESEEVEASGLGARDTLRTETGLCLNTKDLNEDITPVEASLKWVIGKRRSECGGFPGYDIIRHQMEEGVFKKRVGFVIEKGAPARENAEIYSPDGEELIGRVTSGIYSPSLRKPIGMAYVDTRYTTLDSILKVSVRNKMLDLKITKMPFVKKRYLCYTRSSYPRVVQF